MKVYFHILNLAVVFFCTAVAAATWAKFRQSDAAVAEIEWYSPLFLYFVIAVPANMCGPLMILVRRIVGEKNRTITGPWLAWAALGIPEWLTVAGLWSSNFELRDAVLAGVGDIGQILVSLVVACWFVCACLERMVYWRMRGTATTPIFWLCGILSLSSLFVVIYGYMSAEALM